MGSTHCAPAQEGTPQPWAVAVRQALAERERTMSWAARKVGLSPSHLHRVLEGERPLTEAIAQALAALLELPLCTFGIESATDTDAPESMDGAA